MNTFLVLGQTAGFLPTRGSIMIDFVFVAMFAIVLVLGYSIYLVRVQKNFWLHKWIQIVTAIVLLLAVVAFEVDMRFFTDWQALAEPSSFGMTVVKTLLAIHLVFAIPTPILWAVVIWRAVLKFPSPVAPNEHSASHRFWAWISAIGMIMTAVTGWIFYYAAFVA